MDDFEREEKTKFAKQEFARQESVERWDAGIKGPGWITIFFMAIPVLAALFGSLYFMWVVAVGVYSWIVNFF